MLPRVKSSASGVGSNPNFKTATPKPGTPIIGAKKRYSVDTVSKVGDKLLRQPKDFMTEATVENEHLRTKIRSLQSNLKVQQDLEKSLEKARNELEASEKAREALQAQILQLSEEHARRYEQIVSELRAEVDTNESLREQMAEIEKSHNANLRLKDKEIAELKLNKKEMQNDLEVQETRLVALADIDQQRKEEKNSRLQTQK